jgi:hypothetical protein
MIVILFAMIGTVIDPRIVTGARPYGSSLRSSLSPWLGHAHLDTTNQYAPANLETKRKTLGQADPSLRPAKPPRWKQDADLLTWLGSRRWQSPSWPKITAIN